MSPSANSARLSPLQIFFFVFCIIFLFASVILPVVLADLLQKSLKVLTCSNVLVRKLVQLQHIEALQRKGAVLQDVEAQEEVKGFFFLFFRVLSSESLLPQSACFVFPVFPVQHWHGAKAGRNGGDAAGSSKEGRPGCYAPHPTAARV